jgi:hypothetical protein
LLAYWTLAPQRAATGDLRRTIPQGAEDTMATIIYHNHLQITIVDLSG